MIGKRKSPTLSLGGDPTIDLLPPELRIKRRGRVLRRRISIGIFLLALIVSGAATLVQAQANQAREELRIAQLETQALARQQQGFLEVEKAKAKIGLIEAAQQVGISTEINWHKYLNEVQATLPSNVTVDSVNIDSATPFSSYLQPVSSLQGERIATLNFTATSSTLPRVPDWLKSLATLPGFVDASPGSMTRNESGSYSVNITLHIDEVAFSEPYSLAGGRP